MVGRSTFTGQMGIRARLRTSSIRLRRRHLQALSPAITRPTRHSRECQTGSRTVNRTAWHRKPSRHRLHTITLNTLTLHTLRTLTNHTRSQTATSTTGPRLVARSHPCHRTNPHQAVHPRRTHASHPHSPRRHRRPTHHESAKQRVRTCLITNSRQRAYTSMDRPHRLDRHHWLHGPILILILIPRPIRQWE